MDPAALAGRLEAIDGRMAGTDAERRAAVLLAGELRRGGRRPRLQTLWVRRNRQAPRALYAVLGVAGSVVAVSSPEMGLGLAAGALLALLLEAAGVPVGRLLQPRRATQNVVAPPPAERSDRVLLILAAAADAPRDALINRIEQQLPRFVPGALALLAAALAAVAACAGARIAGAEGAAIGAVQLVPSVVLILLVGGFVDAASASPRPGAPAGGAAAVVAVAAALDAQPPRALDVEVLIGGAGRAGAPGAAAHVRARRRERRPEDVVLLELGDATGPVRVITHAGEHLPLRLHPRLADLAAGLPRAPEPRRSREHRTARVARGARWPAIGLEGEPRALAAATLRLVAAIDAEVGR